MIDVFAIAGSPSSASPLPVDKFPDDEDGKLTIELLKKADRIVSWIAGNGPNSLGLHPAIYYYSDRGRHIPDLFLGMILFVSRILEKNEKHIFQHFSANRLQIEQTLIEKKSLILQALQLLQSKYRVEKTASFLRLLSDKAGVMSDEEVVTAISPNSTSRIISIREAGNTTGNFTDNTKSAIAIRQSLQSAVRCSICHGYLDPIRSTSYDHVIPARENGSNEAGNGAMSHPFCNTGVKN